MHKPSWQAFRPLPKQTDKQEIAHLELDKIVPQNILASLYFPPPCLPGNAHIHGPHLGSIHVSFRYSMRELPPQKMFVDIKRHQRRRRCVTLHCFVYLGSSVSLIAYPSHASRLSMQRFWRQILHWIRFHFPFLCCKAFAFKHLYIANFYIPLSRGRLLYIFALTYIVLKLRYLHCLLRLCYLS